MNHRITYCSWDGRPCLYMPGHAVAYVNKQWTKVDDADVGMSAKTMSRETYLRTFPDVPPVPQGLIPTGA